MKLLICGSRKLNDEATYQRLKELLSTFEKIDLILHGGAKGVDQMADRYARENGIPVEVTLPNYQKWHYKLAPLKRNDELVKECTELIAVYAPDHIRQGGTGYTAQKALAAGKQVTELLPTGKVRQIRPATLF